VLENVSIIIPAAQSETSHNKLLNDLKKCSAEIIVSSENGRADSLNQGVQKATRDYLWFIHADTRVTQENIEALEQSIQSSPAALHYFDLKFDGYGFVAVNAFGANIRSRMFELPYGDQGLCISKENFGTIGKYRENVAYGEDLLFVRSAKRRGIKLKRISSTLITSARKYRAYGWLKLSLYRQWQLIRLLMVKI